MIGRALGSLAPSSRGAANDSQTVNVNWFSPLLPEKSGVAEFTASVAPQLAACSNVTFFSGKSPSASESCESDVATARSLNRAEMNFFNIGNNSAFHSRIWRTSRKAGGIVILHDAKLQHLFGGIFLIEQRDPAAYAALMRRIYGLPGSAAANLLMSGRESPESISELFPLVEAALEGAAGVVVHSQGALDAIRGRTTVPAVKLNLPYAPAPGSYPNLGPRGGGAQLRLVAFGHIGPNRRIESVLQALARVDRRRSAHLHVIGDVWDDARLRRCARELGMEDRLSLHGHLTDAELDEHLRRADLAINLRWPTMGEASYSQLRAWWHGVPTLVTDTGWYAELPDDAVIKISPEREVDDIAFAIERCRTDFATFARIGERGRAVVERDHLPETYVDGLFAFTQALAGSARVAERNVASRIAEELAPLPQAPLDAALRTIDVALGRGATGWGRD